MIIVSYMEEWANISLGATLTTKMYATEEEVFEDLLYVDEDEWGLMSEGLLDWDCSPMSEEKMKEILTGEWNGFKYYTKGHKKAYTFKVIKITVTL